MSEEELRIHRINNLDGGLISSISSRLLDQAGGMVQDIRNLSFEYPGIVTKRRGTEEVFGELPGEIKGLFEFEKTSEDASYVVAACKVSNDLVYLYWNAGLEVWTVIQGAFLVAEPDFASFADQLVIANSEESFLSWDGSEVKENLGAAKARLETFFVHSNNDLRFTAKEAGKAGNYIRIKIIEPEVETPSPSVGVTGNQTAESPLLITITPAWEDVVPHKMGIHFDNPIGGTFQIGDPFGYRVLDHNFTIEELEAKLKEIYGEDNIVNVEGVMSVPEGEPEVDVIITFASNLINSYLRVNFSGLEYDEEADPDPTIIEVQAHKPSKIISTSAEIKGIMEADETIDNLLDIEHITGSDGSGVVTTMSERALTRGYDAVSGAFMEHFRGRILLAGNKEQPNLLRGSHTGDPSLWDPANPASNSFEMFVGPDDGTSITGLLELGDGGVLIGKHKSLYALFGYTRDNFVVDLVDSQRGVVNHESMGFVKPYGLFVSTTGVFRYEAGSLPEVISLPIQEIFDFEVDKERLVEASAVVRDREYILTLPAKEGEDIVLVYYVDGNRWTRWTEPAGKYYSDYSKVKDGFLFAKAEGGEVFLYGVERGRDSGVPFDCYLTTVELDGGLPEIDKYFGDLYIIFRTADVSYDVSIEVTLNDNYNNTIAKKETIEASGKKQKVLRAVVGREARFMEVTITHSQGVEAFNPLAIVYTYRTMGVL